MSIAVMARVWQDYPGAGGSELLAMLALADWSDDEGRCWPSMTSIADKTRLSRSQAQRVVHGLITDGYLLVIGNAEGGKPGTTRQYRINLHALTGRMDATPTGRTGATGSAHATGRTDAAEGSHGCGERGRTGATQTVIEPSITTNAPGASWQEGFDRFWTAYPKRKSKGQAEKAFRKINPSEQLLATILAALEQAKTSIDWTKDAGQFIPYPASWLNAKGWEDELAPGTSAGSYAMEAAV